MSADCGICCVPAVSLNGNLSLGADERVSARLYGAGLWIDQSRVVSGTLRQEFLFASYRFSFLLDDFDIDELCFEVTHRSVVSDAKHGVSRCFPAPFVDLLEDDDPPACQLEEIGDSAEDGGCSGPGPKPAIVSLLLMLIAWLRVYSGAHRCI
ncbi:MAG: hypothetical protein ACI9MR_003011, partial [Myxococcota bacterium]